MSDRKQTRRRSKRRGNGVVATQRGGNIPRYVAPNDMIYSAVWAPAAAQSGTSGIITFVSSPSIQSSTEYSLLQSIFNEVRLLACVMTVMPHMPYDSAVQSGAPVYIGTNMAMNGTTFTNPNTISLVLNLPGLKTLVLTSNRPQRVPMVVPKDLEFLPIDGDIPTLPAPYAGSPGVLACFSSGQVVSQNPIFHLNVKATWHLRGRH